MLSLYQSILAQHPRQLTPVRCADQTIAQLHRYFEDVVLENNLAALVVEGLPLKAERTQRSMERLHAIGRAARHAFYFVAPADPLHSYDFSSEDSTRAAVAVERSAADARGEHFVIIADARFSALLVARGAEREAGEDSESSSEDEVVWSFEPDVVYSALEYLMARVKAECARQKKDFASAVRRCVPKATSLQLTVSVTTKLARLLQEQAAREVAVNRIASAIRGSLELPSILQTTVNEVGRALNAHHCALHVEGEHEQPDTVKFYSRGDGDEDEQAEMLNDLDAYRAQLRRMHMAYVRDGRKETASARDEDAEQRPVAVVPFLFGKRFMGVLMVRADAPGRVWHDNEMLLLHTVADQVAVAVQHSRLYAQQQRLALTDSLTGCLNRRAFELQLERDLKIATRARQPVSLIMLDVDHFKRVNDEHGHDAGDAALRFLSDVLRGELRAVDTAARYGGEEFAVILPQAAPEDARAVAERLRARLEATDVPGIGPVTASFGVATFPVHAAAPAALVSIADQALYAAKRAGRNSVAAPPEPTLELCDELFDLPEELAPPAADAPALPAV
ncbi:MAG TPA: diguanylate cyclase [Pyrinomonadaceae bacterium]|nr:diguanylate cyclase [Pyrinomonadaceae bacterium]